MPEVISIPITSPTATSDLKTSLSLTLQNLQKMLDTTKSNGKVFCLTQDSFLKDKRYLLQFEGDLSDLLEHEGIVNELTKLTFKDIEIRLKIKSPLDRKHIIKLLSNSGFNLNNLEVIKC